MVKTASMIGLVLLTLMISLSFVRLAGAVDITPDICNDKPEAAVCQVDVDQTATENTLVGTDGIITIISQWLVWISGALAVILIIISGLMFIFSSGSPESAGRARRTLFYAVIGVAIAVTGQAIVTFVLEKL